MRKTGLLLATALLPLLPTGSAAQVAWDGPFLLPPRSADAMGIYLVDLHGGGIGAMATWRSPGWNYGLRGGIGESGDGIAIFGGIDFAGAVHRENAEFPLDVDWVVGAGIGAGDGGARVSAPVGLTLGHVFTVEGAVITPWTTPRVFLDAVFGRDVPEGEDDSDVGLGIAVDLGVDLRLTSADAGFMRGVTVRVGASLGDRDAIAFGLVF